MTRVRRGIWRPAIVLPAIVTALAGTAVAVAVTSPASAAPANNPIVKITKAKTVPGGVQVAGWDYDPNAKRRALTMFASVDRKRAAHAVANLALPGLARTHPAAGPAHGFKFVVPVPEGNHGVCVRAVNLGRGTDTYTCFRRTYDYGPVGALEQVNTVPGAIHVKGWDLDQDKPQAAITTTITIDGRAEPAFAAILPRPDLHPSHPFAGPHHGFDKTYPVTQGAHTVCVVATNIGFGSNNGLGCKTVTLNDSPQAALETTARSGNRVHVKGWAYDPDALTTPLSVTVTVNGKATNVTANAARADIARTHPRIGADHGFDVSFTEPQGTYSVCVTVHNVSFGTNRSFACRSVVLNFTPSAALTALTATTTGATVAGWASDPDTSAPISVKLTVDGTPSTLTANAKASAHSGHAFSKALTLTSGAHTVCAVGVNVLYGTANSPSVCKTITLALSPFGQFQSIARTSATNPNLKISGWAIDPDTKNPLMIAITVGGKADGTATANVASASVAKTYPAWSTNHGFAVTVPVLPGEVTDGEQTVCITATNVGGGKNTSLGCKLIIAVHPVAPSAPTAVVAQAGFGGATITWKAPASDGGAPWSQYSVVASPGGASVTVGPTGTSATVLGLKASTNYTFSVAATNVAGKSKTGISAAVKTQSAPPPQTSPAPVSTSRYIRNIKVASAAEQTMMRNEGTADARANPSGHGYLVLLDIGGQDQADGGVVLSAGVRFVSYANLVTDLKAYVDGYHNGQRPSAPVTIAIGTNNDMDVSAASGKTWAATVVQPVVTYAKRYLAMAIAGADDMEPGFRATYAQTSNWLNGYLGATKAPFIFNGSADGCAWTVINRGCNNGWTMGGLYHLAAGANPVRLLNLPQIYNDTMAAQWKYISLTGVQASHRPRIDFAGTLTEFTACDQSDSCGSLTGRSAWSQMWANLQSDSRLKVASLPYSTDLRIDS